jgi:hypothetical protein
MSKRLHTLRSFTATVNGIARRQCDLLNQKFGPFSALHHDYPESMLKYYYEAGYTVDQTLDAITDDVMAEAQAEAAAS